MKTPKTKKTKSEIVNGNLTCVACGSTTFKVNTTHSIDEDGTLGRIQLVEIECSKCAAAQLEIDEDVAGRDREFFKSTTYADRGEE